MVVSLNFPEAPAVDLDIKTEQEWRDYFTLQKENRSSKKRFDDVFLEVGRTIVAVLDGSQHVEKIARKIIVKLCMSGRSCRRAQSNWFPW